MKTGRYRDHLVDDIVDRCFVMFHTRYHKGRPRGFPPDKEVYVCEARYNEEKYTFNRIKTWTSCLPDEVRERDYEMDLFQIPRKLSKEPTPIAHLLAHNAKPTDPLPKPNWGHKDAPPIIGAVHMRPREPNVSHVMHLFPPCLTLHVLSRRASVFPFTWDGWCRPVVISYRSQIRLIGPSIHTQKSCCATPALPDTHSPFTRFEDQRREKKKKFPQTRRPILDTV